MHTSEEALFGEFCVYRMVLTAGNVLDSLTNTGWGRNSCTQQKEWRCASYANYLADDRMMRPATKRRKESVENDVRCP